jgi:hypothetical protein
MVPLEIPATYNSPLISSPKETKLPVKRLDHVIVPPLFSTHPIRFEQ